MENRTRYILLGCILLVGAALRVFGYWQWSFSNDELSALARLDFPTLHDLIYKGVRIDGHPAAAQVLLYYLTRLFGTHEAVVRLPFVLAGTAAIFYVYRIGRAWHSISAGLLMAACFATLEFPLLYSRIARPYALGMLFATMAVYHWVRVMRGTYSWQNIALLSVSLALCAYTHYFCGLTAAVLALCGTLLIKGNALRHYLYALCGAIVLFLPHLSITLHQLTMGGVAWVGVPENDWIWSHLRYILNDSYVVVGTLLATGLLGWAIFRPQRRWTQYVLPAVLFLLPMGIGFFYSKYLTPVLQHSVLLFSFPLLLAFLFSGWDDARPKLTMAAVAVLLGVGLFSTVHQRQFFQKEHFGVFKELAFSAAQWKDELGDDLLLVADVNHPPYLNLYLQRTSTPDLRFATYRVTDEGGLLRLKQLMEHSKATHLAYAWSTVNQSPEVERVIREKYPIEERSEPHFNSGITLFKQGTVERHVLSSFPFSKTEEWNCDPAMMHSDSIGKFALMTKESPYGPTFTVPVNALVAQGWTGITIYVEATMPNGDDAVQLVFEQADGEDRYAWESRPFAAQIPKGETGWAVFDFTLLPTKGNADLIKLYPWSVNGAEVKLTRIEVRGVRDSEAR